MAKKSPTKNGQPKRRGRPPKAAQAMITEMEPEYFADIDDAAEAYADARDQRMELTKEEASAQEKLLAVMKSHKEVKYQTKGGLLVEIKKEEVEKAKVKRPKLDED